jgi:ribosomal protein S1
MSLSSGWVSADSDLPEASDDTPTARIELNDGSVIYGDIADIQDGGVLVSTALMGDVTVALTSIARLDSDQAIELLTTEQDTLALSALKVVDGEVVLEDNDNLAVDQLDAANPEAWEVG